MQKLTYFIISNTDLKFLWGQLVGITPTTFWPWGNCPYRPPAVGTYAWTYYSAEANTQKGWRMHQSAHFKINNVKKIQGWGRGHPFLHPTPYSRHLDPPLHMRFPVLVVQWFGVGLVIKRSLVRLPAGALSHQLGQLSLPSVHGR